MQHILRRDMAVAAAAALLSIMLLDLLPGPTVLLTLGIGCVGALGVQRKRAFGRTMLDAVAGATVALLVLLVVATVRR